MGDIKLTINIYKSNALITPFFSSIRVSPCLVASHFLGPLTLLPFTPRIMKYSKLSSFLTGLSFFFLIHNAFWIQNMGRNWIKLSIKSFLICPWLILFNSSCLLNPLTMGGHLIEPSIKSFPIWLGLILLSSSCLLNPLIMGCHSIKPSIKPFNINIEYSKAYSSNQRPISIHILSS